MAKNSHKKMLKKAYKRSLKKLNKAFFIDNSAGVSLFVEYLRYLRDSMLVDRAELSYDTKIATLITAVAEYDAYAACKDNKAFHWNNFCELVRLNMEEWLQSNDSI